MSQSLRGVPGWLLLALVGFAVLAVLVLASLPARMVVHLADPDDGLNLRQVSGTLWRGDGRIHQPGRSPLVVRWRWQPPLDWGWEVTGDDIQLAGRARPGFDRLDISDARGSVRAARLDLEAWLPNVVPRGHFEIDLPRVVVHRGLEPVLTGRMIWEDAGLDGAIAESLGRIEIVFDPAGSGLSAAIASLEPAPITVRGRLVIESGNYDVDIWIRAERNRPDLARQLTYLGDPQPDGQVRIVQQGRVFW